MYEAVLTKDSVDKNTRSLQDRMLRVLRLRSLPMRHLERHSPATQLPSTLPLTSHGPDVALLLLCISALTIKPTRLCDQVEFVTRFKDASRGARMRAMSAPDLGMGSRDGVRGREMRGLDSLQAW